MPFLHRRIVFALLAGALGCSDRAVEEDEPPDVEGLSRAYCERLMGCVLTPEDDVGFDTVDECTSVLMNNRRWEPACEDVMEDMMICYTSYDCPEFRTIFTEVEDGPCRSEIHEYSICFP